MRRLATEAVRAGAIGFSTSRTLNHRTATGDPTPSLRAGADELEAIASGVADAGHGVMELISDFWPDPDAEFALIRRLVERTGCPLSVSLAQSHQRPEAWRDLLARSSRRRPTGSPSGPRWRRRPSVCCSACRRRSTRSRATPPFKEIAGQPLQAQVAALRDPDLSGPPSPGRGPGRLPAAPGRLRPHVSAGRGARLRAGARDQRAAHGRVPRRGPRRAHTRPAGGGRWAPVPLRALLQLRRRRPRGLPRDARAPRHGLRAGRRRRPRRASSPTPASPPTRSRIGHATAAHGRVPVGWVVEQLTSATATRRRAARSRRRRRGHGAPTSTSSTSTTCAAKPPVMAYDLPAGGKRLLQRCPRLPCHGRGRADHVSRRGADGRAARAAGPGCGLNPSAADAEPRGDDMTAGTKAARARAGGRVAGGRRRRPGVVDAALERGRPRRARCRAAPRRRRRAPTRSSSDARTSRSTAWPPSSTPSSTSSSTAAASPASPPWTPGATATRT